MTLTVASTITMSTILQLVKLKVRIKEATMTKTVASTSTSTSTILQVVRMKEATMTLTVASTITMSTILQLVKLKVRIKEATMTKTVASTSTSTILQLVRMKEATITKTVASTSTSTILQVGLNQWMGVWVQRVSVRLECRECNHFANQSKRKVRMKKALIGQNGTSTTISKVLTAFKINGHGSRISFIIFNFFIYF